MKPAPPVIRIVRSIREAYEVALAVPGTHRRLLRISEEGRPNPIARLKHGPRVAVAAVGRRQLHPPFARSGEPS